MQLKNRIKKIENKLNVNSEFCRCQRDVVIKVEPRNENEEPSPPEICETCGKTIDRFRFDFNKSNETELVLPPYRVIEPGDELQEDQR